MTELPAASHSALDLIGMTPMVGSVLVVGALLLTVLSGTLDRKAET
eukprot:gene14066-13860_t